jgi:predicted nucleic acid-binding Zn ribbon protein
VITCVNCGTENEADSVFCSACNHFLQWEEPVRETRSRRARRSSDLAAALGAGPDPAGPAEQTPAEPEPPPAEPEPVPADG